VYSNSEDYSISQLLVCSWDLRISAYSLQQRVEDSWSHATNCNALPIVTPKTLNSVHMDVATHGSTKGNLHEFRLLQQHFRNISIRLAPKKDISALFLTSILNIRITTAFTETSPLCKNLAKDDASAPAIVALHSHAEQRQSTKQWQKTRPSDPEHSGTVWRSRHSDSPTNPTRSKLIPCRHTTQMD
jgi:hypothetical protein